MSKANEVIQLAVVYIKNDNIDNLQKVLTVMPLDKLGDRSDNLLSIFLSVCAGYGRKDAAKIIIKAWKVIYPPEEVNILSRLFLIGKINLATLAFIILSYDDYTYIELMDDLITLDSSPEVITACQKADQIFGSQSYETYKIVQEHAQRLENDNMEEYATDKMEETAPFASIPKWVQNYSEGPLVTETELEESVIINPVPFEVPSDDEIVELLTQGLGNLGISVGDINRAKEYLLKKLSVSTRQEKIEMIRPVMETQAYKVLSGDKNLYRIFGPSNPLINQDLTLNTSSSKYGGCRMFLCDIFNYDSEFDYVVDWFRGVCDQCHLRIRHRWHALRRPRVHGGWEPGSYCSWNCVRESIFIDGNEPDLLGHELINIFEQETDKIGIQDRLERDN